MLTPSECCEAGRGGKVVKTQTAGRKIQADLFGTQYGQRTSKSFRRNFFYPRRDKIAADEKDPIEKAFALIRRKSVVIEHQQAVDLVIAFLGPARHGPDDRRLAAAKKYRA